MLIGLYGQLGIGLNRIGDCNGLGGCFLSTCKGLAGLVGRHLNRYVASLRGLVRCLVGLRLASSDIHVEGLLKRVVDKQVELARLDVTLVLHIDGYRQVLVGLLGSGNVNSLNGELFNLRLLTFYLDSKHRRVLIALNLLAC